MLSQNGWSLRKRSEPKYGEKLTQPQCLAIKKLSMLMTE